MRRAVVVLFFILMASPVFAQTYVAGLIGADAIRSTRTDTPGSNVPVVNGEALSGALRVGTSLGARWGVELEFSRDADFARQTTFRPPIVILRTDVFSDLQPVPTQFIPQIFPPITFEYQYHLRERHTTISPVAWVSQTLSGSVELAYVGGFAFTQTASALDLTITRTSPLPVPIPILPPTVQRTRRTLYDMGPVAGIDARFTLTDHVRLLTGIRMQTLKSNSGDAWGVRASAGLGWVF
jgi:hypothetical protein